MMYFSFSLHHQKITLASITQKNHIGAPIFRTGWVPYNSLANLRDPYLDYLVADSRPFSYLPAHLRDAYISPVRRSVPRQPVRFGKTQSHFDFPFFLILEP